MEMKYPKVRSVRTEGDKTLWVKFDNGVAKLYDGKPLLSTEPGSVPDANTRRQLLTFGYEINMIK